MATNENWEEATTEDEKTIKAKLKLAQSVEYLEWSFGNVESSREAVQECRTAQVAVWKAEYDAQRASLSRRLKDVRQRLRSQNTSPSKNQEFIKEQDEIEQNIKFLKAKWATRNLMKEAAQIYDLPWIENGDKLVVNPPDLDLFEGQWSEVPYEAYAQPLRTCGLPIEPSCDMRFYVGKLDENAEMLKQRDLAGKIVGDVKEAIAAAHAKYAHKPERVAMKSILQELSKLAEDVLPHFMAIAPTGSGKTSMAFELARKFFVLYLLCTSKVVGDERTSKLDPSAFKFLVAEIKKRSKSTFKRAGVAVITDDARRLSAAMLVSHLFLLYHFLVIHPTGTPYQFLRYQLDPEQGPQIVQEAFEQLRVLTESALLEFATTLRNGIRAKLPACLHKLFLVIDEMENAVGEEYPFLSRGIGEFGKSVEGVGLLTPLLQAAGDLCERSGWSLLVMGQESICAKYQSTAADFGKSPLYFIHSDHFPRATKEEVDHLLRLCGLTDTTIAKVANVSKHLYAARFGLVAKTVENLSTINEKKSKCAALQSSVDQAIEAYKKFFLHRLSPKESREQPQIRAFCSSLQSLYVSARMGGHAFSTKECPQLGLHSNLNHLMYGAQPIDWCLAGLAHVNVYGAFYTCEELVLDVLQDYIKRVPELQEVTAFDSAFSLLKNMVDEFGTNTTVKGTPFEAVAYCALQSYNGTVVSQLPFVALDADHPQKEFWDKLKIVTLGGLVRHSESDIDADLLVTKCAPQKAGLSPSTLHRADIVMLLFNVDNEQHEAILQASTKLYSNKVPSSKALEQYRSTDPKKAYFQAKKDEPNPNADHPRRVWRQHGLDKLRALRIHIIIPGCHVPRGNGRELLEPGLQVLSDGSLVVNIYMEDIDKFFGILDKQRRIALYHLLFKVTQEDSLKTLIETLQD